MADLVTLQQSLTGSGRTLSSSQQVSVEQPNYLSIGIPAGATDYEVFLAVDQSQLVVLFIVSDYDLTLKTNNAVTPTDTINLVGGEAQSWLDDQTAIVSADVSAIYVDGDPSNDATLQIYVGHDPTP